MDWNTVIERHRAALMGILAALVSMAASRAFGDCPRTLPRHVHRAVLRLLRPTEAAARRLVIALARNLPAPQPKPLAPRQSHSKRPSILINGAGTGIIMPPGWPTRSAPRATPKRLSLPLFDPLCLPRTRRRPVPVGVPRMSVPGFGQPFPVALRRPPSPDDLIDAVRVNLRLQALAAALDDLPAAARRFARWQARLNAGGAQDESREIAGAPDRQRRRFCRLSPLKPGRPPGWRRRPVHAVHEVLNEAHWLALTALERPDTS